MPTFRCRWFLKNVPSEALPLTVGSVTFNWAIVRADDLAREQMKDKFGPDYNHDWFTEGVAMTEPVAEAASPDAAVRLLHPKVHVAVDLLALRLPTVSADISLALDKPPTLLPTVFVMGADGHPLGFYTYMRELLMMLDAGGTASETIRRFNSGPFLDLITDAPAELFEGWTSDERKDLVVRTSRAAHWWAEARAAELLATKFVLSWMAFEALATCPEDPVHDKGVRIKTRIKRLTSAHLGEPLPDEIADTLWNLRCEIVHEAVTGYFDPSSTHAQSVGGLLHIVQYLLFIVFRFLFDSWERSSLLDIWDNVDTYAPGQKLAVDSIPAKLLTLEMMGAPDRGGDDKE